jgi:hypothetical protein
MAFFSRPVFYSLIFIVLLSMFNAQASDNDYLKMLESEAEDAKLDQSGQLKDKKQVSEENSAITKWNWNRDGDINSDALPPGLTQDEFATLLKQNFYGTFVFYRKLNSVDQNTIYYHYKNASPAVLEPVRQDILSHLKK